MQLQFNTLIESTWQIPEVSIRLLSNLQSTNLHRMKISLDESFVSRSITRNLGGMLGKVGQNFY